MSELEINAATLLGVLFSLVATSFIYEPKVEYIYLLMGAVAVILIRVISIWLFRKKIEGE